MCAWRLVWCIWVPHCLLLSLRSTASLLNWDSKSRFRGIFWSGVIGDKASPRPHDITLRILFSSPPATANKHAFPVKKVPPNIGSWHPLFAPFPHLRPCAESPLKPYQRNLTFSVHLLNHHSRLEIKHSVERHKTIWSLETSSFEPLGLSLSELVFKLETFLHGLRASCLLLIFQSRKKYQGFTMVFGEGVEIYWKVYVPLLVRY